MWPSCLRFCPVRARKALGQFEARRVSNFLMVASDLSPFDGKPIKAPDIFELMMSHDCWD